MQQEAKHDRVRFSPSSFCYNGRVALALLPSLIVLAGFGGQYVIQSLVIGSMVTYILDALKYKEAAFISIWTTLGIANMGASLGGKIFVKNRSILLSLGMMLINNSTLALLGSWITLQFRWIQEKYPAIILGSEQTLITGIIPLASAVLAWGMSMAVGFESTAYYLMCFLCIFYHIFSQPLLSSFLGQVQRPGIGGKLDESQIIQSRATAALNTLLVIGLPGLVYFLSEFSNLDVWSLALLISFPILFVCANPGSLWWLPPRFNFYRKMIAMLSLIVVVAALEGRVVLKAFDAYIPLYPPWNWLLLAFAMYGFAAICVAHYLGVVGGGSVDPSIGGALLVLSMAAAGFVVGLPLPVLACGLIGTACLALFQESRQFLYYVAFTIGMMVVGAYLVHHHYNFLQVDFEEVSLQMICKLIIIAFIPALLVPGLVLCESPKFVVSIMLVAQSLLVAFLEERLYAGVADINDGEITEHLYPAYLVVLSSVGGIMVIRKLLQYNSVGKLGAWIAECVFGGKLVMLLMPQNNVVQPFILLLLAAWLPNTLHEVKQGSINIRGKLPSWQATFHIISILLATAYARFAIFDTVQYFAGNSPQEGVLLGCLILAFVFACIPLAMGFYARSQQVKRYLATIAIIGALVISLQPPLPIEGGVQCPDWIPLGFCPRLWDDRHIPLREIDDSELYGAGYVQKEKWTMWLLVLGAFFMMFGISNKGGKRASSGHGNLYQQGFFSVLAGSCVGLFIAMEYFYGPIFLQFLIVIATILSIEFVVMVGKSSRGDRLVPLLCLWIALFPVILVIHAGYPLAPLSLESEQVYAEIRRRQGGYQDERYYSARLAILICYAVQGLLMALALKIRVSSGIDKTKYDKLQDNGRGYSQSTSSQYNPKKLQIDFFAMCVPSSSAVSVGRLLKAPGGFGSALRQFQYQGILWVPLACNLITLFTFLLTLIISHIIAPDKQVLSPFLLSPILLLLHQDPIICKGLLEQRRYFPPILSIVFCLLMTSYYQIIVNKDGARYFTWFNVKNCCLEFLSLPAIFVFLGFLWDRQKRSMWVLLFTGPISLLPLLLGDLILIKVLAAISLAASICQYIIQNKNTRMGMKLI